VIQKKAKQDKIKAEKSMSIREIQQDLANLSNRLDGYLK
jgi:hypothetical protein